MFCLLVLRWPGLDHWVRDSGNQVVSHLPATPEFCILESKLGRLLVEILAELREKPFTTLFEGFPGKAWTF